MASRFDFAVAAPPDDGHQGSFTTPDQVMQVPSADRAGPQPPLATFDANRTDGAAGASPLMMLLAALAFLAITALFVFVYAWPS
jgi:hypothetical protein